MASTIIGEGLWPCDQVVNNGSRVGTPGAVEQRIHWRIGEVAGKVVSSNHGYRIKRSRKMPVEYAPDV